jgi:hypothetical protein
MVQFPELDDGTFSEDGKKGRLIEPGSAGSRAAYNRRYYEQHKARLTRQRKKRYENDPEYRRAQLRNRRAQAAREKAARQGLPVVPKKLRPGKRLELEFPNGDSRVCEMFSIGQFAERVGVSLNTIRNWEQQGVLPRPIYFSVGGHRLYTSDQMETVRDTYLQFRGDCRTVWTLTDEFIIELHRRMNALYFGVQEEEE